MVSAKTKTKNKAFFSNYWEKYRSFFADKKGIKIIFKLVMYIVILVCLLYLLKEALLLTSNFLNINFNFKFNASLVISIVLLILYSFFSLKWVYAEDSERDYVEMAGLIGIFLTFGVWNLWTRFIVALIILVLTLPSIKIRDVQISSMIFLLIIVAIFYFGIAFIQGVYGMSIQNNFNISLSECHNESNSIENVVDCRASAPNIYAGAGLYCRIDNFMDAQETDEIISYESGYDELLNEQTKTIILTENITKIGFFVSGFENNVSKCYEGNKKLVVYSKEDILWHKEKIVGLFLGLLFLIFFLAPDAYKKWLDFFNS